jgi:uncharacterized protein (TIGR00295 family)
MQRFPSPNRCIQILKEAGCSNKVITHCKAVRDVAVRIAQKAHANVKLVEAGALLHDIGRTKTHGIFHAIEGAALARKMNLPEEIVLIIERHIGAGLPSEIAQKLGLPARDFIPQTLEEKIVSHADNLIDDDKQQPIEKEIENALRTGKRDYARRLVILHKELSDICGMNLNDI